MRGAESPIPPPPSNLLPLTPLPTFPPHVQMAALLSHLASSREERAHLKAQLDLLLTGRSPDEGPKGLRSRETPYSVGVTENSRLCLGSPETPSSVRCDPNPKNPPVLFWQGARAWWSSRRSAQRLPPASCASWRGSRRSACGWRSRCGRELSPTKMTPRPIL